MTATQIYSNKMPTKGTIIPAEEGINKTIVDIFKKSLEKKCFDAILIPVRVPETEAYAWVLLKDQSLLDEANPLPPIISVQGAKALRSLTKRGKMTQNIAAILRPCEIKAAVELSKLKQIHLDNISLISIDCPGAMPLSDYLADPEKSKKIYKNILEKWGEDDSVRPVCHICNRFSLPSLLHRKSVEISPVEQDEANMPSIDLHIGLLGGNQEKIFLIPVNPKGKEILEKLELKSDDSLDLWQTKVSEVQEKKEKIRKEFNLEFKEKIEGQKKLTAVFDECINCHNCMRACPICYCQQCFFDSDSLTLSPETYISRAEKKGALRFPLDTMLFHLGRMSHMVLSCVSCGVCEDACPMSIPVAQIFSLVADQTQKSFDYAPGINKEEPLPLQDFLEDEFHEVETPSEAMTPEEVN